jgi:hypothetical protein
MKYFICSLLVYFGRLLFRETMPSTALGLRLVRRSCIKGPVWETLLSEAEFDARLA